MTKPILDAKDRPLNEFEAAAALGVSVFTLRQRRFKSLQPTFLKIGRTVRYLPADLEMFKASCRRIASGSAEQR